MTEYINAIFLLVSKFKMIGMVLNVVHGQVQESNGLITIPLLISNNYGMNK